MKKSQMKAQGDTAKPKSRAHEAILESARDLESLGVISKRTLRGYEKRAVSAMPESVQPAAEAAEKKTRSPLRHFTAADVVRIRAKVHASQGYFAMRLRVSPTTVQQWESGAKKPSGMATTLLETVDKRGLEFLA